MRESAAPSAVPIPSLAAYFDAWLPRHALTVRPKTVLLYRYVFDHFLASALGALLLTEVTRELCLDAFAAMARQGRAPNTIQMARAALSACLRDAFESKHLVAHPLVGLRMRGRAASVRQPYVYADDEYTKFIATTARKRRDILACFALLGRVGLRPGEALALRSEDVNLTKQTARIERTAHDDGRTGPPKTRSSRRIVDLPLTLCDQLREQLDRAEDGWLFPAVRRKGPLPYRFLWRTMRELADSAVVPRTTPHSLRHYAAGYMLVQLKLPLVYVSQQLGHANLALTASTYVNHLRLDPSDAYRAS